jgi:glycosyltransferase involved in cell wall biosynthesis
MNLKPFLSILIPTRNRGKYAPFAVQSALNLSESDIEILVSDNHSNDETSQLLSVFSDPRLKIFRPEKPLPMHGNWEYLLSKAKGQWIYFLGDDDALMPHAVGHLKYIAEKYPQAEAVVSERAYYYWDEMPNESGKAVAIVQMSELEEWVDSKKSLKKCLSGEVDYIHLPQIYAGGFQRRSLVNRVRRAQNGVYFKSVSPDAYSAVAACLHTYRFLRIGIPLAWVGSSPHSAVCGAHPNAKDRRADFEGMHSEDDLTYCAALGSFEIITFTTVFFEAYVSSFPCGDNNKLNYKAVNELFVDTFVKLRDRVCLKQLEALATQLGVSTPTPWMLFKYHARKRIIRYIEDELPVWRRRSSVRTEKKASPMLFYSEDSCAYPTILSLDQKLHTMYNNTQRKLD